MDKAAIPACQYGARCYRKNPQHLLDYSHPSQNEAPLSKRASSPEKGDTSVKKPKCESSASTSQSASTKSAEEMAPANQVSLSEKSTKYRYYMTYIHRGIDNSYNQGSALTLHNVINGTRGTLVDSCLFSYMYDLDWIRQQFKPGDRDKPMTVVEGLHGDSRIELLEQRGFHTNIKIIKAKLPIPYGVHHTKMMILRYDIGIRIMITTANLVPTDWFQKSQALWCSPLCPRGADDSITNFKSDLVEYLSTYSSTALNEWADIVKLYDMSKCKVFLIASAPGRHKMEKRSSFGHLRLRQILSRHGPSAAASQWPVIAQFSSIGKLGATGSNWLTGEFLTSLSTTLGHGDSFKPELKLIYPTVEEVRTSLEGYQAGGSLPFAQQTYNSQLYMRPLFHKWKSERRGRTRAAPHIKSYLRLSTDNSTIPWFLMTSANLSKAAWGVLEKDGSQLMIRSYELGVLFLPQMFDADKFVCDETFSDSRAFPVPFDLPPSPYDTLDDPWIVDKSYREKRDSVGDYWH